MAELVKPKKKVKAKRQRAPSAPCQEREAEPNTSLQFVQATTPVEEVNPPEVPSIGNETFEVREESKKNGARHRHSGEIVVGIEASILDPRYSAGRTIDAAEDVNIASILSTGDENMHRLTDLKAENEQTVACAYTDVRQELKQHIEHTSVHDSTSMRYDGPTVTEKDSRTLKLIDLMNEINIEEEITGTLTPYTDEEKAMAFCDEEILKYSEFVDIVVSKDTPTECALFKLLMHYHSCLENIRNYEDALKTMENDADSYLHDVWTLLNVMLSETGYCGDKNKVKMIHSYPVAKFNAESFALFSSTLTKAQDSLFNDMLPNKMNLKICEMNIEAYLCEISKGKVNSGVPVVVSVKQHATDDLRSAIEILFFCQRKARERDKEFIEKTRNWLNQLIAVLLRLGTWKDHVFILCHVLRSPCGIADWAVNFIQCPTGNIFHNATTLRLVLEPIKNRDVFLKAVLPSEQWVLLDEEGDDTETYLLNERDLDSLLNQICLQKPLHQFIATDIRIISEYSLFRLLTLLTNLVTSIQSGLNTYFHDKYKQIRKRLGRMCRELLEIASNQLELLANREEISSRLQLEFDSFFLQTAKCINSTASAWQFLAGAPFKLLSSNALWRLFAHLQLTNTLDVINVTDIENILFNTPEDEQIYLVSTLCNMVLGSSKMPEKLLRCITLQIFYVGFLSLHTREILYKTAASLLTSIIDVNLYLLSEILVLQDRYFDNGLGSDQSLTVELWQRLNLDTWVPDENDMKLLDKWIKQPPDQSNSLLARCIFKAINHENIDTSTERDISFSVAEVSALHADASLSDWIWSFLPRLHLHVADRSSVSFDFANALYNVPDFATARHLALQVDLKNPVACFVALSSTSMGHSVPLIYSRGISILNTLLSHKRFDATFLCLERMAVMFWDCPESLISCDDFIVLLTNILNYDKTYLNMAKSVISSEGPGIVIKKFAVMLCHHLNRVNGNLLAKAAFLWVSCFTKVVNWHSCGSTVYLLDVICRRIFFCSEAWSCVVEVLELALNNCTQPEAKSPMSSIMKLISSYPPLPTLLPRGHNGGVPWFSFLVISLEFVIFEERTTLWSNLLQQLSADPKLSIEGALKKACAELKLEMRSPSSLCIYRWANLALDTPASHPLIILIWYKFMELYLSRVPGLVDRGSVGNTFFAKGRSSTLKNSIIQRLKEDSDKISVTKAFHYWLSHNAVLAPNLMPSTLSRQFCPDLLYAILRHDQQSWVDLLPIKQIEVDWNTDAQLMMKSLGRSKKLLKRSPSQRSEISLDARLKSSLQIVDTTLPPPIVQTLNPPSDRRPSKALAKEIASHIHRFVRKHTQDVKQFAQEKKAIEKLIERLYYSSSDSTKLSGPCSKGVDCRYEAQIVLKYTSWQATPGIEIKLRNSISALWLRVANSEADRNLCLYFHDIHRIADSAEHRSACIDLFFALLGIWSNELIHCNSVYGQLVAILTVIGNEYVANDPSATLQLFDILRSQPKSMSFLLSAFTPNIVLPSDFVKMYKSSASLRLDLLNCFNVKSWLRKQDTLHDELLDAIFTGVRLFKDSNKEDRLVLDTLNKHLRQWLEYNPDRNWEMVLKHVVQSCVEHEEVPKTTWIAFFRGVCPSLSKECLKGKWDSAFVRNIIPQLAEKQDHMTPEQVQRVVALLGEYFMNARSCLSKDTLYDKFKKHPELLFTAFGVLIWNFICSVHKARNGKQSVNESECAWKMILAIFGPWILPYINEENNLFPPYNDCDVAAASISLSLFCDCVKFLSDTLCKSEVILSQVWTCYANHFCTAQVTGIVLSTTHSFLSTLPWTEFTPSLNDLEVMLQIVNKFLPHCQGFIGTIFLSVNWDKLIQRSLKDYGNEINTSLQVVLLHLFVKISMEKSVKSKPKTCVKLQNALSYSWHLLGAEKLQPIITWFGTVCNPCVILDECNPTDNPDVETLNLRLLKMAAGYSATIKYFHPTTRIKRQLFVALEVKCLATVQTTRKAGLSQHMCEKAVAKLLDEMETVVSSLPLSSQCDEVVVYLAEVLKLLGEPGIAEKMCEHILKWISAANSDLILNGLLLSVGQHVVNPVRYAVLVESLLDRRFMTGSRSWEEIIPIVAPYAGATVDQNLIKNASFLTLYVLIRQRLGPNLMGPSTRPSLNSLLHILSTMKPTCETEPKFMLLIGFALQLISTQTDVIPLLEALSQSLITLATDRPSSILSTIGITKSAASSVEFKLTCLITAAGISTVLQTEYAHCPDSRANDALSKAEATKAFQPVLSHMLAARNSLAMVADESGLVSVVYNLSAQLFGKLYFVV